MDRDLSDPDWSRRSPVLDFSENDTYTALKEFEFEAPKDSWKVREEGEGIDPLTSSSLPLALVAKKYKSRPSARKPSKPKHRNPPI